MRQRACLAAVCLMAVCVWVESLCRRGGIENPDCFFEDIGVAVPVCEGEIVEECACDGVCGDAVGAVVGEGYGISA